MNILITSDTSVPGVGGMENAIVGLCNALIAQNHNVMLIAPHYDKKRENDDLYNFKIYRKWSIKIQQDQYLANPFYTRKLDRIIKDFKPDIIHCHSQTSMLIVALKIKKKYNIPCICTMHTKYSYNYNNNIKLKWVVKLMCKLIGNKLKKVDKLITVSKDFTKELAKYGYYDDFQVIKNGANIEAKEYDEQIKTLAIKKLNMNPKDNNLLFVGHISKIKNIDFIIDSLEILYNTFPQFKLYLVGNGENEKYFQNRIASSVIKDNVVFTGVIMNKQLLSSIYYNSKLFLFPSIADNDSLTIIEAATFETPSITIESTGSSERITNDVNGFIIHNDVKDMTEKIEYLLKNQDIIKKVGLNAKNQLPKSWIDASQEYLAVYNEVINKYKAKKISKN